MLVLKLFLLICEFVLVFVVMYAKFFGDMEKARAFFRNHKKLQIATFIICIIGIIGIMVRILTPI